MPDYDAVVVGSGPNGLAAAIVFALAGHSVLVIEAKESIGGGCRTQELTLPGFVHDVCSAIHPYARFSPFFRTLPLERFGLEWIQPPIPLAHPFDDGTAALLERTIEATSATLDCDAGAYAALMTPIVANWETIAAAVLGPLRLSPLFHPFALTPFGLAALSSASSLAKHRFKGKYARGIFAGMSAHSMLPMEHSVSAAAGLILAAMAHVVGWPFPRGGAQKIVEALAAYLRSLGGEIITNTEVKSIDALPYSRVVLFDVTPRQLLSIAGHRLPGSYKRALQGFRYGPGIFKIDFALSGPIPWKALGCLQASTVHLGATLEEIAFSERQIWHNQPPERPYVLTAQQSLFDPTRAPQGKQTAWAYCHVPHASTFDMTERIEAQIERFAPGFRDLILAKHTINAAELEQYNPNYIGGDINGGVFDLWQLFTRPTVRPVPYSTPVKNIFICSSSTPPGGGVHGLCGYFAAQAALRTL